MTAPTPPPRLLCWLPNAISILRLILVPVWLLVAERLLPAPGDQAPTTDGAGSLALPLLWLAIGISDVLDGYLARRWHVESRAGATIDAVADKAAQIVAFTWLALRAPDSPWMTGVPLWFFVLLVARDGLLLLGTLAIRARRGEVEVVHRWHGKAISLLMFATVLAVTTTRIPHAERLVFGPLAAFVIYSTACYVRDGFRQARSA